MRIKDERRSAVYDDELHLEAYRFEGIVQPFPAHFHEHYVLGLVERGERRLSCCGKELTLRAGDLLLLNPGDSHACEQRGGETLDYEDELAYLTVVDFSNLAQGCKTYSEFIEKMAQTDEAALSYLGIALCGNKKKMNKLTGSLPLLR